MPNLRCEYIKLIKNPACNQQFFFGICNMIQPGSCYWNIALGREKGEAENDKEGVNTMQVLGQNMAWLMKLIARA